MEVVSDLLYWKYQLLTEVYEMHIMHFTAFKLFLDYYVNNFSIDTDTKPDWNLSFSWLSKASVQRQ